MEPGNDGFPIAISFSMGPCSGSMFVLGGVHPFCNPFLVMKILDFGPTIDDTVEVQRSQTTTWDI